MSSSTQLSTPGVIEASVWYSKYATFQYYLKKIISLASCSLHWSFNHVQARNYVFMQGSIRDKTRKLCLGSHKKKCLHTENSYTSDIFCTCTMFLSDIWRNILHLIHLWLYGYFQNCSERFNLLFHDVGSAVRWLHYVQLY